MKPSMTDEQRREARLTYNRAYYAANKAKIAVTAKAWRQKNPEKVKTDRARYKSINRAKVRAAAKAYYHATKETRAPQLAANTKRRNAMRPELVRAAREAVVGPKPDTCQACGGTDGGIVFDHCHAKQHPRGWLCDRCNVALGCLKDSPERLEQLLRYLKRSERYQRVVLTGWAKTGL